MNKLTPLTTAKRTGDHSSGGYIALVSVLIASALLLLVGVGITFRGIDTSNMVLAEESAFRAKILADSCAEEAIMRLKANLGYSGGELIMVDGADSCSIISIGGSGNTERTITARATVNGYTRTVLVRIASLNPSVRISSWDLVVGP